MKFISTTDWDGWRGSPLESSAVLFNQGTSGFDDTPAFGMTMSIVFCGEKAIAALKDETRSSHFVTSVLWYWALECVRFVGGLVEKSKCFRGRNIFSFSLASPGRNYLPLWKNHASVLVISRSLVFAPLIVSLRSG